MNHEHIWPEWLIKHAQIGKRGVAWWNGKDVHPKSTKLPLCKACNTSLGDELEGPVSAAIRKIEVGHGCTDREAELLVRWLWKFEGLFWCYSNAGETPGIYSTQWTLIDRVATSGPFNTLRNRLTLAAGLINENDFGFDDWPLGLDSGLSFEDGIFVSGVFGRTALMCSLSVYAEYIPDCYGKYTFPPAGAAAAGEVFYPPTCFPCGRDAVIVTKSVSRTLKSFHEAHAASANRLPQLEIIRPGVLIPKR